MNLFAVSQSDGGASTWGVVASFLAVAVTVGLGLLNWRGSADSLRRAERLGDIAENMSHSAESALVNDMRDRYMVEWVLRKLGPRYISLQATSAVAFSFALLFLVLYVIQVSRDPNHIGDIRTYVTAAALGAVGQIALLFRREYRRQWTVQEKERRGIESRIADRTEFVRGSRVGKFFPNMSELIHGKVVR